MHRVTPERVLYLTPDVLKFEYLSQLLYDSNFHILLAKILSLENAIVSIAQSMEIPGLGHDLYGMFSL